MKVRKEAKQTHEHMAPKSTHESRHITAEEPVRSS